MQYRDKTNSKHVRQLTTTWRKQVSLRGLLTRRQLIPIIPLGLVSPHRVIFTLYFFRFHFFDYYSLSLRPFILPYIICALFLPASVPWEMSHHFFFDIVEDNFCKLLIIFRLLPSIWIVLCTGSNHKKIHNPLRLPGHHGF